MRVKVLKSFVGKGFSYGEGEVVDLPHAVARAWQAARLVQPLDTAEVETAAIEPVEKAVRKRPRKRKR